MNSVRDKKLNISADSLQTNRISNGVKKIAAFLIPFLIPLSVVAAETCRPGSLCNPLGFSTLYEFLIAILNVVIYIAFPAIVLFLVWIGFKFVTAQGNAEELKKVRGYFLWAIVGALLVLGARVLATAIQATVEQLR